MRFRTLIGAALIVTAVIYVMGRPNSAFRHAFPSAQLWSEPEVAHSAGLGTDELNNIDVYKSSNASVVYITSTVIQRGFFGFAQENHALGSGFIINADGQIMTNFHVISGSSDTEVTLPDQTTYKAKVLVKDRQDDLALIKIEPRKKLTPLHLGDSDHLQVGQKVLAIGQPFGLKGTLTVGVISAQGVGPIQGENNEQLDGLIQTDAAINSGNSGGPLLDSQGNVIAINTAILGGGGGGNIGIGFAMPINRAKLMLDDYRAGKNFGRAWLGAGLVYIAGDLAEALKLPASGGLLIQDMRQGSAADKAGLHGFRDVVRVGNQRLGVGGDFITAVDGKPVTEQDAVTRAASRKRPGDVMVLTIYRNGRSQDVKVILGEAPDEVR
jgi:S1-C subfamily serine protease